MCTHLTSFPDPTKPAWEQDAKLIEILEHVEDTLRKETKREEGE